jgi:hypothetical protein
VKLRTTKFLPLVIAVAFVSPLALAGTASAAAENYSCGSTPPDLDPLPQAAHKANGVNMRTGSSTSCTSRGLAYDSDVINYQCWTAGSDWTWTYARDVTTGRAGWMRDDLLTDGGSRVHCPQ